MRCAHASEEEHHEASAAGMGLGKYRVWRALVAAGDDLSAEEASSLTMRELLDRAEAISVDLSGEEGYASDDAPADHAADAPDVSAAAEADTSATGDGTSAATAGAGHRDAHGRHAG